MVPRVSFEGIIQLVDGYRGMKLFVVMGHQARQRMHSHPLVNCVEHVLMRWSQEALSSVLTVPLDKHTLSLEWPP